MNFSAGQNIFCSWPAITIIVLILVFPLGTPILAAESAPEALLKEMGLKSALIQSLSLPDPESSAAFAIQVETEEGVMGIQLKPWSIRSGDFQLLKRDASGNLTAIEPPEPTTYRGEVVGIPGSRVAASLRSDGLWAWIHTPHEQWMIQPDPSSKAGGGHIVFRQEDSIPDEFACAPSPQLPVPSQSWMPEQGGNTLQPMPSEPTETELILAASGVMTLEMAVDTDRELYEYHGSSSSAVLADVESIMNAVNLIYEGQFQISHTLTAVVMRTTVEEDLGWETPEYRLEALWEDWYLKYSHIRRDLVHHFCENDMFGTTVGIAYTNVICNVPYATYGISQTHYDTDFSKRVALTAHEIGHNWGAGHCDDDSDCQIMCSAIGACEPVLDSFGSSAFATIAAHRDTSYCLTPAFASVVYVDDTVPFPGHGTFSDPFATVGLGAQNSLDGGFMLVRPGQYTETPVLMRPLLIKAGNGSAVIGR